MKHWKADGNKNKKKYEKILRTGFFLLILLLPFLFSSCGSEPVQIGVIISLSGTGSHLSEVLDGIELKAEELNSLGGINGREIELIVRDNESNPDKAEELFKEIEEEFHPDLYITGLSFISGRLMPLAEQAKVPLLCLVTAQEGITDGYNYSFTFFSAARDEADAAARIIRKLGSRNTGLLYQDNVYSISVHDLLKEQLTIEGFSVKSVKFPSSATSPEALIPFMEEVSDVDTLFSVGLSAYHPSIIEAADRIGFDGSMVNSSGAVARPVFAMEKAEGLNVVAPVIYNTRYLLADDLRERFSKAHDYQLSHFVANGYESLFILESLLTGKEVTRESIRENLEAGFVYTGTLGSVTVPKGSHNFVFPLHPAVIHNGGLNYE